MLSLKYIHSIVWQTTLKLLTPESLTKSGQAMRRPTVYNDVGSLTVSLFQVHSILSFYVNTRSQHEPTIIIRHGKSAPSTTDGQQLQAAADWEVL